MSENTRRPSSPSQYTGAEIASSAAPMLKRSSFERGLRAERTPIGIPTSIQTTKAPTVSAIVTGSREKICELTETLFWYE
jgi:hypothetical protein